MRKAIALIGILAAIALPEVAIANGYSQTASGAKKFVFTGLPPNQTISISINLWPRDKSVVPNACGLTVIKPLTGRTIVLIDSASEAGVLSESLPIQSIPSCSGGQLSETRANNFRTSDGAVVLINRSGFVRIVENLTKTIKSNRCGIANLSWPKQLFPTGWYLDGTSFSISGQPTLYADDMRSNLETSVCRLVGGQPVRYVRLP